MLPRKVDLVLRKINNLRPMPSSVTRILKEIDNPYTTVTIISEYIGLDQALTAAIIKASNAATMGYGKECTSISDAVMRIGFKRIKGILLAANVVEPMSNCLNGYRLGAEQLWIHSLKIAMASEWIGRKLRYREPEEGYVVGLLHDIGKLLLDQFVLEDYQRIIRYVKESHLPLWQVEEKLIGVDHATLGGMMAARWNFPEPLVEGICYHHVPSAAKIDQKLPALVNLANYLATQKMDLNTELVSNDLYPDTLSILSLDDEDLPKLQSGINTLLGIDS